MQWLLLARLGTWRLGCEASLTGSNAGGDNRLIKTRPTGAEIGY